MSDLRAHAARLIHDSNIRIAQTEQNIAARRNPTVTAPAIDDITSAYASVAINNRKATPVYRTVRFLAHAKYSLESQRATTSVTWQLGNYGNGRGKINAKSDFLESIVSISIEPFLLPASMISAGELAMKQLSIYFTEIKHPESVMFDYTGAVDNVTSLPVHMTCSIVAHTATTYEIIPNVDKIVFSSPISLREIWGLSFYSVIKQLNIPAVVIDATVSNSNPLGLTITGHGLLGGEYITIDSGNYPGVYTTLIQPYAIVRTNANQITVTGVDGTTLPNGSTLQITILSRAFRIPFTFTCIDRSPDGPSNVGSVLTV